jgi:hypothetical protein
MFEDADLIHCYTRADAIEDGTLIDVTNTAKEAGFLVPVALTATVWGDCISWSQEDSVRVVHQEEAGRLWDVVWMAGLAGRQNLDGEGRVPFAVYRVPRDSKTGRPVAVALLLDLSPGDEGEPVVTIGFAEDF